MGIDVTAFGLPILLRERARGWGKKPLEKRLGIGYFMTSIEQVGQNSDIYPQFARAL